MKTKEIEWMETSNSIYKQYNGYINYYFLFTITENPDQLFDGVRLITNLSPHLWFRCDKIEQAKEKAQKWLVEFITYTIE